MKKILHILSVSIGVLALVQSCRGTWVMYDEGQMDHLYFCEGQQVHTASFSLIPENEIVVTTSVFMMGVPSDQDRTYSLETIPVPAGETFTTGGVSYPVVAARENIDYSLGRLVLPAGAVETTLEITLHRTPEMLEGNMLRVGLRIKDDGEFLAAPADSSRTTAIVTPEFYLFVNDGEPSCPSWWRASGGPLGWHWDFGRFFPDKYRRFLEYFHATEQTNPSFYNYCVAAYGYYLDTPDASYASDGDTERLMNTFWRKTYSSAWAKYVFIPLYNYYKEWYAQHPEDPNVEPMGPGTINQGNKSGWSDPMDPTYGFFN